MNNERLEEIRKEMERDYAGRWYDGLTGEYCFGVIVKASIARELLDEVDRLRVLAKIREAE